jgi:hypothetical protein
VKVGAAAAEKITEAAAEIKEGQKSLLFYFRSIKHA